MGETPMPRKKRPALPLAAIKEDEIPPVGMMDGHYINCWCEYLVEKSY
jgi:hypothetical protein